MTTLTGNWIWNGGRWVNIWWWRSRRSGEQLANLPLLQRPRNDTIIEATFDMAYSDVNETPQTKPQERETLRPFLIRAQTLPFRLPSYSAPTSGQCSPSGCSTP